MPQIDISQALLQQIDDTRPPAVSTSEFVAIAVREKLEKERRAEELLRLVESNRQAMLAQGLTEEDVIADFEAWRRQRHE